MKPIKHTVGTVARRLLPADSARRRVVVSGKESVRAGLEAYKETSGRYPRSAGTGGTANYSAWRAHNKLPRVPTSRVKTTFRIIIEGAPDDAGVRLTQSDLARQEGVSPSVTIAPAGTPLSSLLENAGEDFVLFLRPGTVLEHDALASIAKFHRVDPALQVIGFDSDLRARKVGRTSPLFRPIWSPETLLGANYFGRAFAVKTAMVKKLDSVVLSDRGIWELLLRMELNERNVGRLPLVLMSEVSRPPQAATADDAKMVQRALNSRGEATHTSVANGIVRVQFDVEQWPSVSIVIPTRHSRKNLGRLLPSLESTDYPSFDVTIIDNGGESDSNNEWYEGAPLAEKTNVLWWTETPFNYSRVNNVASRSSTGDILVMLNDDTAIVDGAWLKEMVGVLLRDGVGTVGTQHRQADGLIQHAGVVVGPGGFADNLFAGMKPDSDTIMGPTSWYRDTLAVTGACVAIRRTDFEEVGGLDERFILCGSDVVLGLDQIIRGRRNAVVPFDIVRHYESLTRGTDVPQQDFFASYWRYHPWLQNGDPYMSPNVSRLSAVPRLSGKNDAPPVRLALQTLNRRWAKIAQSSSIQEEAMGLVHMANVSPAQVRAVHDLHQQHADFDEVRTINWFIPDVDMPFFGGLNTCFRMADKLARENGVVNRFVVLAEENTEYFRSALAAAFPALGTSEFHFYNGSDAQIQLIPEADASVATLWLTAVHVAKAPGGKRKFYLMQDYEPAFYPASTLFAMAEESYRLGLYAICNTESMHRIYTSMYGGKGTWFAPAVDRGIYHAVGRRVKDDSEPVTIFAYARDHFRNCWELAYASLREIKRIHGDNVRIVVAGARYLPPNADFIDLGLLDYRATAQLYRETDIGLTLQISRHPSYLPLELMACGVPMVAPDSEWFKWLFQDGENSALAMRTFDGIVENLDELIRDKAKRTKLAANALSTIDSGHSSWDAAMAGIYDYMCAPEAQSATIAPSLESMV
jgi:GT2 family glycosyltransferase